MRWIATILELLTLTLTTRVAAQVSSNVTCSASSLWMQNDKGQNPCLVSAYLSSVCNSGVWSVNTLGALNEVYSPPSGAQANTCRCNTVDYSLLQACALCQGGTVLGSWQDWIASCDPTVIAKTYPNSVPIQTAIPGWAFLDPTGTGTWNATVAQAFAAASASGASSGSEKKSVPIGAIIGGVLGGIVLIVAAVFGFWFHRQRSSRGKGQRVRPATYSDAGLTETVRDEPTAHRIYPSTGVPLMSSYHPDGREISPPRTSTSTAYVGDQSTYQPYSTSKGYAQTSLDYPPYQSTVPLAPYSTRSPPRDLSGAYTGAAEV